MHFFHSFHAHGGFFLLILVLAVICAIVTRNQNPS